MAIGGDQGGSIRVPASWCGVVGLKPTYGLVPYTGAASNEYSLDHVGPIARTVEDCALLLEVITYQTTFCLLVDRSNYPFEFDICLISHKNLDK